MRRRILVVEDDRTLRQTLSFNLTREGYDVTTAADGETGLEAARSQQLDLILLDVMLPGMSGVEVLRVLRRDGIGTPVIMVSAKGDEIDRVVGLQVGADDYVTKPFSRPELLARIEAVLRRQRTEPIGEERSERIQLGQVLVDVGRRRVTIGGRPLHLTTKEFDLLVFMASHPGRIFTRDQLLARVWGYDYAGDGRTVDVHISWLRSKLREPEGRNYFRTVRGVGYAFAEEAT
jgi:two-component system, OmpR family, alkaline phosphatase synthesis response regulator PhoP